MGTEGKRGKGLTDAGKPMRVRERVLRTAMDDLSETPPSCRRKACVYTPHLGVCWKVRLLRTHTSLSVLYEPGRVSVALSLSDCVSSSLLAVVLAWGTSPCDRVEEPIVILTSGATGRVSMSSSVRANSESPATRL